MSGESRSGREWPWVLAGVVLVAASPAFAFASQKADGRWMWIFFGAQVLVTALAFAVPQVRQLAARRDERSAEQREVAVRVETRTTINDALEPILRSLGEISSEKSKPVRRELIRQAKSFVLAAAANLIGGDRSRACWFELTDDGRLVPELSVGRVGSPTTAFEPGTTAGDAAIGMVVRGEHRLCVDIDAEPPPGWDATKQRDYKTFISVSVAAGPTAYGMLTLDALEPGELSQDDLSMLAVMAAALAAALAQGG